MRIIITGGSGLIGHRLSYWMVREEHEVIVLSRNSQAKRMPPNVQGARWDGYSSFGWGHLIDENTVIVNLAGESLTGWRWTKRHKQRVMGSRIDTTEAVGEAIARAPRKPALLIQASTVGYYGSRGDDILSESAPAGKGFLADVCEEWEEIAAQIGVQTAILRMGFVLSRDGGFLKPMRTAARLLTRQFGDGSQWLSWVHIDDAVHAISHLIRQKKSEGVYNLTAPNPVTNVDFMKMLSHTMGAPRLIGVPTWALNLMMGEQSAVLLYSQRVLPNRLLETGYRFKYPTLDIALDQLLGRHYEGRGRRNS
ncbi:MAG: TIGR01777 family oxidoreductase [Anaerolineae bacterium]|nr:TIGR01777 family oxidoreductase [Anaerolineae bacterium]